MPYLIDNGSARARAVARHLGALVPWVAVACSDPSVSLSPVSADSGPPMPVAVELRPGYFTFEGEPMKLLSAGAVLPVRLASQGGYAAFVGARVIGPLPGPVGMVAELIDPTTGEVLVSNARKVRLQAAPGGAEGVQPGPDDSADFLHLVACPNYGTRMVHGLPWKLALRMDDPRFTGEATIAVVPTCMQGSRYLRCVCECEPGYVFAKCGAPH